MQTISNNSEYIRLNHNIQQEVSTDLDFKGNLLVKAATANNNPVTLKQIKDRKTQIENAILGAAVIPNEKINKVTFTFKQSSARGSGSGIGNGGYTGLASIIFLKQDGSPLYPIAFTKGIEATGYNVNLTNANYAAYQTANRDDNWWYIWFSDTLTPDLLTIYRGYDGPIGVRTIADPNNLSQEDTDYFAQFNKVLKTRCRKTSSMAYNSNNVDWEHPMKAFCSKLCYSRLLGGASDYRNGLITDLPCYCDIIIEAEPSPLLFDIVAAQFLPFAGSGANYTSRYGYVGFTEVFKLINDKYLETYVNFKNLVNSRISSGNAWLCVNLTRDVANNDTKWVKPADDDWTVWGQYGLCAKAVWNPTTMKYDIINGQTNTNDMDTLYADWKTANNIP